MALFDENVTLTPAPRRRVARRTIAGIWALVIALIALLVLTFLPTAYVIQQPGPVYNTLGSAETADGDEVPLIRVEGAETYPTDGALDLLTVQVVGNRERTPSWLELAVAWMDSSRAVLPIESVFPEGVSTEERSEQSAALMVDSQQEATAAALIELGYDVNPELTVVEVGEDAAAAGIIQAGDVVVAADGQDLLDVAQLRDIVAAAQGDPVELTVRRDGQDVVETVTPAAVEADGETSWLLGIVLSTTFDFPIDVTIQLNNVGGPSAGMMFALGIIDTLTEGELNGGENVAGTGTITADGTVGPIGGIRQKMYGAVDADAGWFLAPDANCDEVVGHIPDGLKVFAVGDLDDALAVLDVVRSDGDTSALATCE
ncbi:site-2 protease family protein [Microbacterium sp. SSW1-59]|uniref:YlbL family protein n=1 Tax=Microbacterium xanthum TaxID=3079794 RepID=UPI002AD37BC7|nr:S16 family serine protease [Microbacterium sp. SSW1-59]MDZ8202126.1 site-2 protease family protein [Microbacterium sp. SSW1-59]